MSLLLSREKVDNLSSIRGKVVLVTGGNSGIGWETVKRLAAAGATVILACRTVSKGQAMVDTLPASFAENVHIMELDLAKISSIQAFCKAFLAKYSALHVLVLNAGLAQSFLSSGAFSTTPDGLEEVMGVNFLGHFLLTTLLLPVLKKTHSARVISLTSSAMSVCYKRGIDPKTWVERPRDYSDLAQYGQSKMAMRFFAEDLQRREPSLLCVSVHPGIVADTNVMKVKPNLFEASYRFLMFKVLGFGIDHGGDTTVWCATAVPEKMTPGACYFPVGRKVTWIAHPLLRFGTFYSPICARTEHPTLWEDATSALNKCTGKVVVPV